MHAAMDFAHNYSHLPSYIAWRDSLYIVSLSTSQKSLFALCDKLDSLQIIYQPFTEPDMGNELTAICIEPTDAALKAVSHLPLALNNLNQIL